MQIVVVTTWFPTDRNPGAGSFIARDVAALSQDHDVRVVHLVPPELDDGSRERRIGSVRVRSVPVDVRTPRGLVSSMRGLPALLAGSDVVHTMAAPGLLPFVVRKPSQPWVHTEHWSGIANLRASPKGRAVGPLIRRTFNAPGRVVAVSDYLADAIRSYRTAPVDVVGNIVDLPDAVSTDSVPFFRGDRLKVLGVGTVNSNKGWRFAVEAIRELQASGVPAELVWLGGGPEYDELAAADPEHVRAPGHVPAGAVASAMAEADVFVLPTVSETFSLVTVEALTAGLPVVATGVGAHGAFLTTDSGRLVPREPRAIAEALRAASALDRTGVRSRGLELAERFDESSFRRRYSTIYEEVVR